jgi:hypothetical protein
MLALLALLVSATPSLGSDGGGQQGRRQRRHRDGEDVSEETTWVRESVSETPLTFDAPSVPPNVDRQRILAEAASDHQASSSSPIEEDDGYDDEAYDEYYQYYHDAMGDEMDEYYHGEEDLYYYPGNEDPTYMFDEDNEYLFDGDYHYLGEGQTDDANGAALYFENQSADEIEDFAHEEGWDDAGVTEEDDGVGWGEEGKGDEGEEVDGEQGGFNDVGEPRVYEPIARGLRRSIYNPASGGVGGGPPHRMLLRKDTSTIPSLGVQSRRKLGCYNVKIQFKVDRYGKETTVSLLGNGRSILKSARDVGAYQTKTMQKCVYPGTYTLKLQDSDGICCSNGKGYYKMWVNGQIVAVGGYFLGSKSHTVQIGKNWQAYMSYRDKEWLNAHNSRRRRYNGGMGYVPLRWSRSLASRAKSWANQLGNNCKSGALSHAGGISEGENLAKNQGSGTWGSQYPADKILKRWVENELNLSYPANAHYTQVVWRATQYVGCGESLKTYNNNHRCRVQVCRYVKAGNCAVRNGNWRAEAWDDESSCGADCPPNEGCFI